MKRSLATVFSVSSSALLVLGLSACGGGSSDAASTDTSSSAASSSTSSAAPSDTASSTAAADSTLVGSGCASYAAAVPDGAGSVAGMAMDPVATAASNNPLLKTLTAAVSGQLNPNVNLVDTLNGSEFTVFAPVDDAFAKLPAATVDSLKTDTDSLTKILTYHVVAGQLDPTAVVGTHATVEGGDLTVTGSGDNLQVNGANVICGGVKTANATVYLIDTVLTPPAS